MAKFRMHSPLPQARASAPVVIAPAESVAPSSDSSTPAISRPHPPFVYRAPSAQERIVEVEKIVERVVEVEVIKEIIVEKPVEVIREVPVEIIKVVEVVVEKPVQVIKEIIKHHPVEVIKEVVVEKVVEKIVTRMPRIVSVIMAIETAALLAMLLF